MLTVALWLSHLLLCTPFVVLHTLIFMALADFCQSKYILLSTSSIERFFNRLPEANKTHKLKSNDVDHVPPLLTQTTR